MCAPPNTLPDDAMDAPVKQLLRLLQHSFPICEKPYAALGEQAGLSEQEVLAWVQKWLKDGLIRRIGPAFSPAALGYKSTLCAAKVPADKLDMFVKKVNALPGVTHNYLRDNELNVWFTLIMPDEAAIANTLAGLEAETGITIVNLPAEKQFKLKVELF